MILAAVDAGAYLFDYLMPEQTAGVTNVCTSVKIAYLSSGIDGPVKWHLVNAALGAVNT